MNGMNVGGADLSIVIVNRERDMACFDAMPPGVRAAIREGLTDYAVTPLAQRIVRSAAPAHEAHVICTEIQDHSRNLMAAYRRKLPVLA